MSHHQARQIVQRMTEQHDERDDLAALLGYIDAQEAAEMMDSATAGTVAHAADRRSHTADARSITAMQDVAALKTHFEEQVASIFAAMGELAELIPPQPQPE